MGLQPHEQRLFKALLELAIEALAGHHSNDFDLRPYLTQAQGEQLMKEYHAYNGDPEEYEALLIIKSNNLLNYLADL